MKAFSSPINKGVSGLPTALDEIARQAQSKQEEDVVQTISTFPKEKIAELRKAIVFKRARRDEEVERLIAGRCGQYLMSRLREVIGGQLGELAKRRIALREELTSSLQ